MRLLLTLALTVAAGCAADSSYRVTASVASPELAYVGPGVYAVADSSDPVFYSDNYYWRYDGGLWYRSSYYNGGWAVYSDVPYGVRSIDRPARYARFTPGQGWSREPYNGGYRGGYQGNYNGGPAVRDHRTYQPQPTYRQPAPAPGVRDHRTYQPAPAPAPVSAPAARDHRPPTYTPAPQPTYRAPPPGPATRDHRR